MGRMNLTVGLLALVLTGIGTLYVTIGGQLRELDKTVAVTAQRSEGVAKSLEHAWARIDRLEGLDK
jgi:hypothetical protein